MLPKRILWVFANLVVIVYWIWSWFAGWKWPNLLGIMFKMPHSFRNLICGHLFCFLHKLRSYITNDAIIPDLYLGSSSEKPRMSSLGPLAWRDPQKTSKQRRLNSDLWLLGRGVRTQPKGNGVGQFRSWCCPERPSMEVLSFLCYHLFVYFCRVLQI